MIIDKPFSPKEDFWLGCAGNAPQWIFRARWFREVAAKQISS